jgi:hypothetical protein
MSLLKRANGDTITSTIWNLEVGCNFVQTADTTAIANTTTDTSFDGLPTTFLANTLTAGTVILWTAHYKYSTTGTPTVTIRHKLVGSSTEAIGDSSAFTTASGVTNKRICLTGMLTIRTAGAAGTYDCIVGWGPIGAASVGVANGGPTSEFGSVSATIDTTQAKTLADFWQWGTASASNTVRRTGLWVNVRYGS